MEAIRRHLSYANVVATLALVFAMSGSAIAARHYLINSTKQIKPSVLKKLKGNAGRTGLTGPRGATGLQGAAGSQGAAGPAGQPGEPLPSGQSESGLYSISTAAKGFFSAIFTFPIPLAAAIPEGNVGYTPAGTPIPHCSGPGHAERGYLCIYSIGSSSIEGPPEVLDEEASPIVFGAGRLGFYMGQFTESASAEDVGTYTVTAP